MRVIIIFIDGLGLGSQDPETNPCAHEGLELLACFESNNGVVPIGSGGFLVPTDATLGVDGLPQSATGQTTFLTGTNCSKLIGRHLQGYPNRELRDVLREQSLLKQVKEMDLRPRFINAYRPLFFKLKEQTKWYLSTTTVANLSAELPFLGIEDIRKKRSIYHDFTNKKLIDQGFEVPQFTPEEAANVIQLVSEEFDVVLYEYFLTDRAGHSQDMERSIRELVKLECFLFALLSSLDLSEYLLIITSDHGNIEDLTVKTHTRNRVMTLLWGKGADWVKDRVRSLEDLTPNILVCLSNSF